jgi:hypothetical protein
MKYYLLSKALKFDRFFDSIEEVDAYIWAKTSARFFSMECIKEHLEKNTNYFFNDRGIDIAIYRNFVNNNAHTASIHAEPTQKDAN